MKKRGLLIASAIFLAFLFSGCGNKETAEKYVGEQITSMKKESPEKFSSLLEEGITDSNNQYVLEFPEELKEPCLSFLQGAFNAIDFEVSTAKKSGEDSYSVGISYKPLDIDASTKNVRTDYLASMTSSDLSEAVSLLLETSADALKAEPVFKEEKHATITVRKTESGYAVAEEDLTDFLIHVLPGYMSPYNAVCEILDARDYMQAYLDATFKGDISQFTKHTGLTEEEALSWYEDGVFDPLEDMTADYTERYTAALKTIFGQCQYTVGIPKKENGVFNYTVDITITPNNSLKNTFSELQSQVYYSQEAFDRAFVELLEKYVSAPVYGEETVVTIPLSITTLNSAGEEDSDFDNLINIILPVE